MKGNRKVLLVEDDEDVAFGVLELLTASGRFEPYHASTIVDARQALIRDRFSVVLADLSLPDGDGLRFLEEIARCYPGTGLLCLTGCNQSNIAVAAIKAGAADYLTKPASATQILRALDALMPSLKQEYVAPSEPQGEAPSWRRAMALLASVARSPRTTVLLTGEPGVGKEAAAAQVHRLSPRKQGPFLAVNASCFSPTLIESELFGHEAGAFTGAQRMRKGLFEQAQGGTLFLDEIGEMPTSLQAKLLRVLEGHPFQRLGGERSIQPDFRLICATNRNLSAEVKAGTFRADLYERLRVFEVRLPPLRERPGDIAILARYFLEQLAPTLGLPHPKLSPQALSRLEQHSFPGNVRELKNWMERALLMTEGELIEPHCFDWITEPPNEPKRGTLEQAIQAHILHIYQENGHNVTRTAQELEISRLTLRRRLQAYGIRFPHGDPDGSN